jgi:hypothetical protein
MLLFILMYTEHNGGVQVVYKLRGAYIIKKNCKGGGGNK